MSRNLFHRLSRLLAGGHGRTGRCRQHSSRPHPRRCRRRGHRSRADWKILGVEMYGTSSSDEKLARVKKLGLQHGINYKRHDYEEVVKNLTHGEGVHAVFEMLGGEHTAKRPSGLSDFGRVIQYGTATGKQPQLDLRAMYAKSACVQGLWLTYLSQKPEIMAPAWTQLSRWIGEKKLTPVIGEVFPLDRAVEAYKQLEAGKNYGKLILKIS